MPTIFRTLAIAGLALGLLATAMPAGAADMTTIDKRKALMKDVVLKNFLVAKNFVQKGKGSAADVAKAAKEIVGAVPMIPRLFPEGTGRPDVDPKKTRAIAAIWSDWQGFEKAAHALGIEAQKLSAIAATGNEDAIKAQFAQTGKIGCGGCHKTFRGDKVE